MYCEKASEKKEKSKKNHRISGWKLFIVLSWILVVLTVLGGLFVPFLFQFLLPVFFNKPPAGVEVWNLYIGIILGVAASVLSIVSIAFCMHSDNLTSTTKEKTEQTLDIIKKEVLSISNRQEAFHKKFRDYDNNEGLLSNNNSPINSTDIYDK